MAQIVLITHGTPPGGTERAFLNLANGLTSKGHPVRAFMRRDCDDFATDWCGDIFPNVEFLDFDIPDGPKSSLDLFHFLCEIRNGGPLIVNYVFPAHWANSRIAAAIKAAGAYLVMTIQHIAKFDSDDMEHDTVLACLIADSVVVSTPIKRQQLLDAGVPSHRIQQIPLGLVPPPERPTREEARNALGLSISDFIVLCLCRLVTHKGVHLAIEALASLQKDYTNIRLLVVGDGPARPECEELVARTLSNPAIFAGFVPDTSIYYAAADIYVMASSEEGFGQTYIEAAFHGIPSIGIAVGGVPYAVEDGVSGFLIHEGDPALIAASIARLYRDNSLRCRLGNTARLRAEANFTRDVMVDGYIEVFNRGKLSSV